MANLRLIEGSDLDYIKGGKLGKGGSGNVFLVKRKFTSKVSRKSVGFHFTNTNYGAAVSLQGSELAEETTQCLRRSFCHIVYLGCAKDEENGCERDSSNVGIERP